MTAKTRASLPKRLWIVATPLLMVILAAVGYRLARPPLSTLVGLGAHPPRHS